MMLASVLAIIPVGAEEAVEGGDTVVEDTTPVGTPVATADEFKAAVEAGKDFYLTASITLPADWALMDFGATMDGNEQAITLSGTAGLFANLNGATIKNVAIVGEQTANGIASGATGAVRFENVTSMVKTVKGNDSAAAFVSGAISPASITFIKCTNMTNVVGGLTGGAFGGWIKSGDLVFEDCANLGNVEAKYAGGYVGAPQNANITVKNSTNGTPEAPVSVKGTASFAGGLFGETFANVTLTDVVNCANVTGGGAVIGGGIIGGFHSAKTFKATNVLNYGAMDVDGAWNKMGGGFIGDANTADASFYFVDCVNFGTMKQSGNNNGGGFLGGNQNSPLYKIVSFVRCINNCSVVKGGNIGGFCGQGNAKEYYFEDCVNNGDINSSGNMSGAFFGWGGGTCDKVTAIRCTNNGAITAQNSGKACAGFMAGRGTKVYTFTDCVNNGAVTAGTTAAGFATGCGGSVTLKTCVNTGALTGKTTYDFTDVGSQVLVNAYLEATPTATTLEGAINVFFNDTTETKDKDWIGLVKEGEDSSTAWAYVKDLKTGFNILDLPVVEGKAITGGYYTIYMVPNDKNLKDVLDPESEDKLLADPITIFLADNIINTAEDLVNTKPGGIYALGADITLPADYVPVDFAASLDGDGHTITLTGNKGLFNKLINASVKNLTVKANIESDGGVGVLATTTEGNVVVDNVTVTGSVKGSEVGGFFQYVNAEGNVTITNSKNNANLTGTQKTAGFIAHVDAKPVVVIDNCVNNGAITRTCGHGKEAGDCSDCGSLGGAGFVANSANDCHITIKNSVNNGAVYGMGSMAGFAGYAFGNITLENCTNNGRIEITNKCTWLSSAAGLVGIFGNGGGKHILTVKGCTNNSDIYLADAGYEGAGGMVGSAKWNNQTEIYFEDSVNVGDICNKSASGNYGGFLGWADSNGTVSFKNCTNYGNIKGNGNNGGFLGQVGTKTLMSAENCVNYGDITSNNNMPGAFSGWCNGGNDAGGTVTIDGFTNYGVITAGAKQASACMSAFDKAANITIKNVTNYGHIDGKTGAAIAISAGSKAVCENLVNNGMMTGAIIGEITNNGSFGEFIEVATAEEFMAMKPGFNYKLVSNIVLPEDYWGGTFGSEWYTAELDGNGKTIYMKGLKSALFQIFHNVNVHDLKIVGTLEAKAALAGEISNYASDVTISNVVIDADITFNKNVGGFIEWRRQDVADVKADDDLAINVTFNDCAFLGSITTTGGSRTGGFIAAWSVPYGNITFNNCVVGNKGLDTAIKGKDGRVAGFVAKIDGKKTTDDVKLTYNNCVNYADIAHTGTTNEGCSGGFGGRYININVTLNNCDNYGDVSSKRGTGWIQGVGGLVGEVNQNAYISINDSNNYGDVYAARSVVGGLLGAVTNASKATVKNSANFGAVSNVNGGNWNFYAGGIVGSTNNSNSGRWATYANEVVVDNCQNYGAITTSNANMGGIVGGIEGAGNTKILSVTNCANYATLTIQGVSNIGGIIGQGIAGGTTTVENNVNYGDIRGASGEHGVGGIMAYPYAEASELIVKNNANYGIVEGGAKANVAGITADTNAKKYTYEGNVNYGTVIGVKDNTSGVCGLINDRADSTFAANYNYGIIVAAKANLVGSIPATVDAGNNYAGGVVVTNEANAALVKALASPYNYDVMGAGRDAWMDLVAALAAAEGVEIPDAPVVEPELATNPVDFTTLEYIIRDWKSKEAVSQDDYNVLFTNTITADTFASASADGNTNDDKDSNAKAYYAKLLPITEDSYYELTFKAKNNRDGGYCGFVFAADAENHPWFVYGGISNHADHNSAESDLRARYRYHNDDGSIGSQLSGTAFKKALDLDEAGFASYKVVYEGLTATVYAMAGGEWVHVVFGDMEAFTLTAGSSVAIGVYNRHGLTKQRTATLTDAALTAPAVEPELVETVIDFTKLTYKGYAGKAQKFDNQAGVVVEPQAVEPYAMLAEHYKMNIEANKFDAQQIGDAGTLFYIPEETLPITADTYYEYYVNAKNNRNTGYAGIPYAMANGVPYFLYGAFHNTSDIGDDVCEVRCCAGRNDAELFGSTVNASVAQDLTDDGFGQMKIVVDGYTATFYTLSGGEWVQLVFKKGDISRDEVVLPEGAVLTPGALFCRDGSANKQRSITIKDAKVLAAPAVAVAEAPATFAVARAALSVEDALAALVDKTALNNAKVELAAMGDVAEDDAKAVALKAAIAAMEAATTQEELNKAADEYAAKVETIVDLTKLNYQLAQAEQFIQVNYTAGTWYEFAKALEAAKNVDKNDQAAVDAAAAALDAAIYGLADISELTNMTQKAIARAEALLPENFGSAGWAVMVEKLAVAKQAFEALDTELMDIAVVELNTAIDALISVEELKALIAELTTINPADYSVVSYAPVASAVAIGLTTTDPVDQAPVDVALDLLRAAKAGLVNVAELNAAIAEAEKTNASRYTEASYAKLLNVLASAKLVVVSADDAAEVADAKAAVEEAVKALRRKTTISTSDLEALIEEVESLDASLYTAESWDALKVALAAAKVALYADTQGKVRDAETALQEAYDSLAEKPVITTDALAALIAEVEALDFTKYTTETWSAVSAALIEAKVALKADDQAVVDAAKAALDAAKAALAEKPELVLPETPTEPEQPTEQPTEKPTEKPTEPADDDKGCGSAIGATVVVMTAVLGLGATVVLKKKED